MMEIAVLITCHNRKVKTLACLEALYHCEMPVGYAFEVFLVDDGSTDGSGDAVRNNYPKVTIIQGDGSLFWNRGMHLAWKTASQKKEYDFYLWLNDDTVLYRDAISTILTDASTATNSAILCGATCDSEHKAVTYGGRIHSQKNLLTPNGQLQACNIIHGNFVLVPGIVFESIGNLDWKFRHAIGDFDYGLRAQKVGFNCYVTSKFIGECNANPTLPKWCLKSTPLFKRFKLLYSPLGYAEPIPFFIYEKRHFGVIVAIKHFFSINLRALLPKLWK